MLYDLQEIKTIIEKAKNNQKVFKWFEFNLKDLNNTIERVEKRIGKPMTDSTKEEIEKEMAIIATSVVPTISIFYQEMFSLYAEKEIVKQLDPELAEKMDNYISSNIEYLETSVDVTISSLNRAYSDMIKGLASSVKSLEGYDKGRKEPYSKETIKIYRSLIRNCLNKEIEFGKEMNKLARTQLKLQETKNKYVKKLDTEKMESKNIKEIEKNADYYTRSVNGIFLNGIPDYIENDRIKVLDEFVTETKFLTILVQNIYYKRFEEWVGTAQVDTLLRQSRLDRKKYTQLAQKFGLGYKPSTNPGDISSSMIS